MLCSEIREKWIKFFTTKTNSVDGLAMPHKHVASSSLVPDNPTLLLTAAGMVQFVPIFMGAAPVPNPPRAVTVQKCVRVGGKDSDLNNIGRTTRHHSFFEMLGNFSFGDYFKRDAINWAWQFVTQELGLEPEKLYLSVFAGDEQNAFDSEAHDIWLKLLINYEASSGKDLTTAFNAPDADGSGSRAISNRIWKLSRKDNFWGPPGASGPCGPCSEIYYDLGEDFRKYGHDERFVEIWNLVFMQFEKTETGDYVPLAKCNIDTGAGLERIATIKQKVNNSFETDELFKILQALVKGINSPSVKYSGVAAKSDADRKTDLYLKIVADHLRCLCFLSADGVRPSNLGRGYVLRMIIRRAARFMLMLTGVSGAQLYQYTDVVCEIYGSFYPELHTNQDIIRDICQKEEEQFAKTISKGLSLLEAAISKTKSLAGDFVFDLYSTYGFPLELTEEIAVEHGIAIDYEGYEAAKAKHSEASSTTAFAVAAVDKAKLYGALAAELPATKFVGYETENSPVTVLAIISPDGEKVNSISPNETKAPGTDKTRGFQLIFDLTPFYAESGGQEGDRGKLIDESASLDVSDTKKFQGLFLHQVSFDGAVNVTQISVGDKFVAFVDSEARTLTRYHHSACHLLQAALRKVLGGHVQQAGSQVGHEYTRFDFNFERGLSADEIAAVEKQVNEWIKAEHPVETKLMRYDAAIGAGALAFFEDKYDVDAEVRVLKMGDASTELCGGTHVGNTGDIGFVKIVSESSVATGIRRIKMLANKVASSYLEDEKLKQAEQARLAAEKQAQDLLRKENAKKILAGLIAKTDEIKTKHLVKNILILNLSEITNETLDADLIKSFAEHLKSAIGEVLVFLAYAADDKVVFMAAASDALAKDPRFNCGILVKTAAQVCGGNGGGKPNFAQAGGKDAGKLDQALAQIKQSMTGIAA